MVVEGRASISAAQPKNQGRKSHDAAARRSAYQKKASLRASVVEPAEQSENPESPRNIVNVVKSCLQSADNLVPRKSFHQQARQSTRSSTHAQLLQELADKEHQAPADDTSEKSSLEFEPEPPEEPKEDVFQRFRRLSSVSVGNVEVPGAEAHTEDPTSNQQESEVTPEVISDANAISEPNTADTLHDGEGEVQKEQGGEEKDDEEVDDEHEEIHDEEEALGEHEPVEAEDPQRTILPDIFTSSPSNLPRETDSPFCSLLPLPRRHPHCAMLKMSIAYHDEGTRKLRRHEYERARDAMDRAWRTMEKELAYAEQRDAMDFAPKQEADSASSEEDEGPPNTLRKKTQAKAQQLQKKNTALQKILRDRTAERKAVERAHKISMGLDLTLVYSRLKLWKKVDDLCADVLTFFGTPGEIPKLSSDEEEIRWITYMVRRAVACTWLGIEHLTRAESYYSDVLRLKPSQPEAKRGLRFVRFLGGQATTPEAYSAMVESLPVI